ncbi:MAG: RagB/SusD family nutrient uptake outer membrane protein [Tannerella sp.]|nr:RagB/SusD family nutrient uptake outer membrane protein [Tannerella sp.]
MKKIRYITSCLLLAWIGCTSCSDDFLQRTPQTKLTAEGFFNNASDLQLYVNGLYTSSMRFGKDVYMDQESDNYTYYINSTPLDQILTGNVTPENFGGWDGWEQLRAINYLLAHTPKATGAQADIDHWVGITRYFRSLWYFDKIVSYSDVPWYGRPLETDDGELLYKASDPRTLVVDSVLADLQFAVDHVKADMGDKTAIHKYAALAQMSRFCLFEGTFRKYHPELSLQNTADRFLEKAVWAAEQLMNSGLFDITGNSGADYGALFNSPGGTLKDNKDVILMFNVSRESSVGHNAYWLLESHAVALTNSLMETYLMADGTPFTGQPGYNEKTVIEAFRDRDPRLTETFVPPGWVMPFTGAVWFNFPSRGGYGQLKSYPVDLSLRNGWDQNYNALPIYRYAEVLLNYAEAKAELGTLTQADVDNTVNRLRDRVGMTGMAHLNLAAANAAPDAVLAEQYDRVTGASRGVILEIRRERRVEMACESLRFRDITRWAAGKLFSQHEKGMYVPALGPLDITGDGVPDVAFIRKGDPEPEGIAQIVYVGAEEGIELDGPGGTSGHVTFTADRINKKPFEEPKWYYRPIPLYQTQLNPQLKQVFGW